MKIGVSGLLMEKRIMMKSKKGLVYSCLGKNERDELVFGYESVLNASCGEETLGLRLGEYEKRITDLENEIKKQKELMVKIIEAFSRGK